MLVVCLNQAADDRLLQTNPAARVKRPPLGHVEREYLRIHEIDLYLSCCSTTYRPLAELLISCGLRISEALGLVWEDIVLVTGTITVNRQAEGARGQTGPTKGRRARSVEAGPDLLRTLTDLKARQGEHEHVLPRGPVFTMPVRRSKAGAGRWPSAGPPAAIDRNTVTRDWHKAVLRDAGLRAMPLHGLRHTAAAIWLYCGQPLIYVQRALGHASITTTESFYGHLEQSLLKTVARDTEVAVRAAGRRVAQR